MKNILGWMKSNVLIVVFCAIVLISLPTAFAFSGMWRESIRAERELAAKGEMAKIEKAKVTYNIPSYDPNQKPVEYSGAPNAELTNWFKQQRESLATAATAVVKRAEEFNRGVGPDAASVGRKEHKPLLDGLFPSPLVNLTQQARERMGAEKWDAMTAEEKAAQVALLEREASDEEIRKLNEMEEVLLAKRGRPYPYQELLDAIHAGGPADPVKVNAAVRDLAARESDKITAGKRNLTAEEQGELYKKLVERRLGEYQAAAANLSLYATTKIWPSSPQKGFSSIPSGKIDPDNITLASFFVNQWDYWVYSDVLAAVRLANNDTGGPVGVANAVVKRIESFQLADPEGLFANVDPFGGGLGMEAPPPPTSDVPGLVPLVPSVSITARGMGTWNTMYDIRRVDLTVVVSSARINEFLDAISRTNFMTVTDLDIQEVNVWLDLREGFYYGPEHVVRAKLSIETVWLRSWMLNYMPPKVASILGAGGQGLDSAAPAAAPGANPSSGSPSNRGGKGGG